MNSLKWVYVGVLGVILSYLGVAGLVSSAAPWWIGKYDAPQHVDYAWQIYTTKSIPEPGSPIANPILSDLGKGVYTTQSATNHPPLFYLLHAPVTGAILDTGNWQEAIAAGRSINLFIGILCILTLAWAGWVFGGKRRSMFAVGVPAFGVLNYGFAILNMNFANDVLAILFATLALVFMHKIITKGLKPKLLMLLAATLILGFASKATFVVIIAVSIIAVLMASILHSKKDTRRGILKGLLISAAISVSILACIGWFYYFHNYRTTGNWLRAFDNTELFKPLGYKSLGDVLTGGELIRLMIKEHAASGLMSVSITSFTVAGYLAARDRTQRFSVKRIIHDKTRLAIISILALTFLGIFVTQIVHAVGYGGFQYRYILPAILPISLFVVYGLAAFRWTRGQLISLVAAGMCISTIVHISNWSAVAGKFSHDPSKNIIERLVAAASQNGVPNWFPVMLFIFVVIGLVLLSRSLFVLSSRTD